MCLILVDFAFVLYAEMGTSGMSMQLCGMEVKMEHREDRGGSWEESGGKSGAPGVAVGDGEEMSWDGVVSRV